jgi:hypothetical protein
MFGLNLKRIFLIAFILAVIFTARQYVPPYFARFQFGDSVRQTVKYAAASRKNTDAVIREILMSAEEAGVPITAKDIHITKRGPSVTVDIEYIWPIDIRIHQYAIKFHVSESGEVFGP